jgi:signal transduction histidine kinase
VYYLSDHEVNRHYAQYNNLIAEKLPKHEIAQRINVDPINYDYREQFLASKSVAADLLQEAKIEIEKERLRNQLFIKWLLLLLLVVVVLFCLVFYGFKKLRQSTTYNNWITTALSHDLRSPVAQITHALDKPNGIDIAKSNLISYEYLLDDTLSMAIRVHGNQKVVFNWVDLTELIDEVLQDLKFIIADKQINVTNSLTHELLVMGDYAGLKVLFRNILLNAIKHNQECGYINIESNRHKMLCVTIENSFDVKTANPMPTAGSQIIKFFTKQNNAQYSFTKQADKAISIVGFN